MAQKTKLDQNNSSEMFSETAACPRHSNNLETKIGEISNFRHLLGLENNIHAQHKPRTAKDSKEIMKKRRERAICIVSSKFSYCRNLFQQIGKFSKIIKHLKQNYGRCQKHCTMCEMGQPHLKLF